MLGFVLDVDDTLYEQIEMRIINCLNTKLISRSYIV